MTPQLSNARKQAKEAERQGDWERASQLRDMIALQSPNAAFWDRYRACQAAKHAGRLNLAYFWLWLLTLIPGKAADWTAMRARIEERCGRDEDAVEWWRKAASLQKDGYWSLFGLARSQSRIGQT